MELYADVVPLTVENFRCLCTGEKGIGMYGKSLSFKSAKFHRIIPEFMAQAGFSASRENGESIYGKEFKDENFIKKHERRGMLSMANSGPDTNCC